MKIMQTSLRSMDARSVLMPLASLPGSAQAKHHAATQSLLKVDGCKLKEENGDENSLSIVVVRVMAPAA